jgi:hypothetical protein
MSKIPRPGTLAEAFGKTRTKWQPPPLDVAPGAWPMLPVGLALTAAWLLFAWPWLSGRVTIPWDAKAHFLPQVQFLAASIARGESPFWAPFVFSGQVQIADPQSMIFSPPMFLLALLNGAPGLQAIDVAVLLTMLAAGLATLLLARDLQWHWAGALVAALALMLGGAMAWRIQHYGQVMSLAYLPMTLLALRRALERSSLAYGAIAGLIAGAIVLGRDQVGLLELYVLAGYVIWHWTTSGAIAPAIRRSLAPLAAGAACGALVSIVPVVLTVLLAEQSNRPEIDYVGAGRGSLHPALLVTTLMPHLFGAAGRMEDYWGPPSFAWSDTGLFIAQNVGQLYLGAIPALMLVVGTSRGVLWDREIRVFAVAAILVLLYALGWYTPVFRAFYEILPGVSLYRRPADAVFVLGALAALLAGYTTHRLFSGTLPEASPVQRLCEAAVIAAAFLFALVLALRLDRMSLATTPLLIAAGWILLGAAALLVASRARLLHPVAPGLVVVAVLAADIAWNNGPNGASAMAPAELDMLEPGTRNETIALLKRRVAETASDTRRDRIELAGLGFHWPNASLTHRLENTLGYNPVRLKLYADATGAEDTVGLPDQRKFSALMPSYRSPLADLLGLRFIATGVPIEKIDSKLQPGDVTLLARTPDGYVYENPRALPRVLFAHRARTADFARMIADGGWPAIDLAIEVLLEAPVASASRRPGTARIVSYRTTEIVLETDSPDGGHVVLNDVWQPWWVAEIDGRPAPLVRANVIFRAVEVPAGRHRVRMAFRPFAGALHQPLRR